MGKSERRRGALSSGRLTPNVRVALVGVCAFLVIALMVQFRLLSGLDDAVVQARKGVAVPILDGWSWLAAILISIELSMLYASAGALALRRAGMGRWSLAPFGFLLTAPLEIAMKLTLRQPVVPLQFRRSGGVYPFFSVELGGSFPSGHALRAGFLCLFLAILLWERGGTINRSASVALVVLALMLGFARVYMGHHWMTDVVAGLLLGGSLALLLAPPVARRLKVRPL